MNLVTAFPLQSWANNNFYDFLKHWDLEIPQNFLLLLSPLVCLSDLS